MYQMEGNDRIAVGQNTVVGLGITSLESSA